MTDKERLEIIKDKQLQMHALSTFDINWLIQQAEKVQELEAENESLRTRRDHLAHRLKIRREENEQIKVAYQDRCDDLEAMRELWGVEWEDMADE